MGPQYPRSRSMQAVSKSCTGKQGLGGHEQPWRYLREGVLQAHRTSTILLSRGHVPDTVEQGTSGRAMA
eukprot:scaffold7546_cov1694-Prasinococcus_capsulatus_cf.AAC.1